MRTRILVLVSAIVVLTGCQPSRVVVDYDLACRDRKVNFIYAAGSIRVEPETIDMCRGYFLTVAFSPPTHSRAETKPGKDNPAASWLAKTSTDGGQSIVIEVSGEVDETYKYTIIAEDVGSIDPHIHIIM
jgi:hypothetical protein